MSEHGNNAAMREALESTEELLEHFAKPGTMLGDAFALHMRDNRDALSKPPRNCDVGTAEEQWSRFEKMCFSSSQPNDPDYCSCKCKVDGGCVNNCALIWAQMPYEGKEASNV